MNTNPIDKTRKAPMKLSEYRSSGREAHVFRAEGPEGLLGVHADLMASSLSAGEKIHYLLYAPIREAGNSPFGIQAEPASHALAVTDNRFLISKNIHADSIPPSIQTIPYSQVMCVEIGNALLLGWLVIRFLKNDQVSYVSMFYTARGSHHFETAIRKFRKEHAEIQSCMPEVRRAHTEVWDRTHTPHFAMIQALILEEEDPLYFFRSTETWGMDKPRRKQVCMATESLVLVTRWGVLYAVDEPPMRPHIRSYGINIYCIPWCALHTASCREGEEHGIRRYILQLQTGKPPATIYYDIPLDREKSAGVDDFVRTVQEMNR